MGQAMDAHREVFEYFQADLIQGGSAAFMDLLEGPNKLVRDPAQRMGYGETGEYANTQRVVMSQDGWPRVITDGVRKIVEDRKSIQIYGCNKGCNRADTSARTLADVLNYIHWRTIGAV